MESARQDSGPLPPGTRLGPNYRIQRVLGRGSMGIVYLAQDIALERRVAVKVLAPHYAADEKVAKRFRREAIAMASVRHEHVVQIYAFGDHEGRPYFVMEYIPGYTVANLIEHANERGEHLYFDVVLGILSQVCRGLEAVHSAGLVHRDVKPGNMLVGPGFRVALADFGLVEMLDHSAAVRDLAGTPLYLAPELIRREELPQDQRHLSDIYALGVSTYEMLTGEVPFDGATVKEILQRHLRQSPRPISDIRADLPTAVDRALGTCLNKVPTLRFDHCGDFLDALNRARQTGDHSHIAATTTRRILVAVADTVEQQICRTALKVAYPSAAILVANAEADALELIGSSHPDALVLDLEGVNGLQLCKQLTQDELTADIPVIALTQDGASSAQLDAAGIKQIIRRPFEATELVEAVRPYIEPPD